MWGIRGGLCLAACAFVALAWGSAGSAAARVARHHEIIARSQTDDFSTPIQHVVVIDQENHSFDNVLGKLCVVDARCDGTTMALTTNGATPLSQATDAVPWVAHTVLEQQHAIDDGKMDGWLRVRGCRQAECLTQFDPSQIPTLAALARSGVIADRYFSPNNAPSFGSHLFFTNQTLDGLSGENPVYHDKSVPRGPGWGCDSNLEELWQGQWVPSCIPAADGSGAFKATPVPNVPTVMDRLDDAHLTWKIYSSPKPSPRRDGKIKYLNGYQWNPCAYNADCLYTSQVSNLAAVGSVVTDAQAGTLPNFSLVVPNGPSGDTSQHNSTSMILGDNWIGSMVNAIQNGPDADSTTIFITYDDCGCFYDHVSPPDGLGIRLPLVIVSPYAKAGYTDSSVATTSSVLAYAEQVLGFSPVSASTPDATAYAFSNSFDYSQPAQTHWFTYRPGRETPQTKAYLRLHPAEPDDAT